MSELLRHAVDGLATPLVIALLAGIAAAVAWSRGRLRLAGALSLSAALLVYLASLAPVGDALLAPLERQYPWTGEHAPLPAVRYVVVLGSSFMPRSGISATSALDREGLVRLVEGVRTVRQLPGAKLVLSGGAPAGREPSAHGYAELARDLGIPEAVLIVLDKPLNTAAEAQAVAAVLGAEPFLLVTSAWHMPRAMRLMARARARALPLPVGQQTGAACQPYWTCVFPTSTGLSRTERAIHEYLGLAALEFGLE